MREFWWTIEDLFYVMLYSDMAERHGLRIPEAIDKKMWYNAGRPYKHGRRKF